MEVVCSCVQVLGEEDQYALVMTTFDGAVGNESLGSGLKVRLNRGRPLSSAVPAVDISLVNLRTFRAKDVKGRGRHNAHLRAAV